MTRMVSCSSVKNLLFGCALVLLVACAGTPLDYTPAAGFDISGDWVLVPEISDAPPSQNRLRARGSIMAFVSQDFPVLRARRLHIEQNRDSMGVVFDDAEYRDVSWGVRQRGLWEVEAGWHEGALVIVSDAKDGEARETIRISPDRQVLTIEIELNAGSEKLALSRIFNRA